MKWIIKKVKDRWYVYLDKKYCKTDEPVCYGSSLTKSAAQQTVNRLNNPTHKENYSAKEKAR